MMQSPFTNNKARSQAERTATCSRRGAARAAGVLGWLAAMVAVSLEAALIVVPTDTNWSAVTGGSGPGGLPDTTDTVMVSVTDFNPDAVDFVSLSTTSSFEIVVGPVLIVTPDDVSRAYGQTNPVLTGSLMSVQPSDNITATYSPQAIPTSPIGNYPIIPTLVDPDGKLTNYMVITNFGTLTVTQAALTVTANPKTRVFGEPDPLLT